MTEETKLYLVRKRGTDLFYSGRRYGRTLDDRPFAKVYLKRNHASCAISYHECRKWPVGAMEVVEATFSHPLPTSMNIVLED